METTAKLFSKMDRQQTIVNAVEHNSDIILALSAFSSKNIQRECYGCQRLQLSHFPDTSLLVKPVPLFFHSHLVQ